jgi:PHD/YefM family antitoxin component YafN of YafNO toxin-antitoxin module
MDTVTIPKAEFEMMKQELKVLRNAKVYKRLLEFEHNIAKGKAYTRKDLGF